MKIIPLRHHPEKYTSRSYLVLGDWNALSDINTLIDPGIDAYVADEISRINTGVGKRPVDQIVLTHNHFDHGGGAEALARHFGITVWQVHPETGHRLLHDGQQIRMGDRFFTVHVLPIHSDDSACLFCAEDGILFSGDTPLRVQRKDSDYPDLFADFIAYLLRSRISIVYPGHGDPIRSEIKPMLKETLKNVSKKYVAKGGHHA
jgi:glyoxylase-like metal-dependent hydrolase (beta-lactamase superfamily II)